MATCSDKNAAQNFLVDRSQIVSFNGSTSEISFLDVGAQQRTITGPGFFSVLLNDLPQFLKSYNHHCLADDFQIYLSGPSSEIDSIVSRVNEDLEITRRWSASNGLIINFNKTQAICYSTVKITQFPDIVFNSTIAPISSKVMNLGIYFDSFLNWNSHINHIISTINK
jgi:hypothetical protein